METFMLLVLCCSFIQLTHGWEREIYNRDEVRGRRSVIEEEKHYNINPEVKKATQLSPWMSDYHVDTTTKPPYSGTKIKESVIDKLPLFQASQTTERATDKPTSRGARASNSNWVKLPFTSRDSEERDTILTPPKESELYNSRMPRIDFVTQNKVLEASETKNADSVEGLRTSEVNRRSEFVRPDKDYGFKVLKPVYPRQALYDSDETNAPYYNNRYYPPNEYYGRDYDGYGLDREKFLAPSRYNERYSEKAARKPKRIIYYANLPEVVRTPPSVDLRYRYNYNPYVYRRPYEDDDYHPRASRYDFRYWNRPAFAPFRKEIRYRDMTGAATTVKKDKINALFVRPQTEKSKTLPDTVKPDKTVINSHFVDTDTLNMQLEDGLAKGYEDVRPDDVFLRYVEPLQFQAPVDFPSRQRY